jgi:hypothetical protein
MDVIDEFSWAVGFWEGEGTVNSPNKGRGFEMSASQKYTEPLQRVQLAFGCGKLYGPYNNGKIYRWIVSGNNARILMSRVYPHLSKRRQIQVTEILSRDVPLVPLN